MGNPTKPAPQPAVIVFGVSAIGKPRAGTFKATEVAAARKAATKLGLTITEIAEAAGRALAAKIPAGRIGGSADSLVPFVSKDLYEQIKALGPQQQKNGKGESAATPGVAAAVQVRLPADWDDIKVGDRVLAQDTDPADGWWQVTVTEATGDLFKLRWPSGRGRPFQKHRSMLSLICPGESKEETKPDSKQVAGEPSNAVYPRSWAAIGLNQIVLAKEDGPAEQWWEAKTIKADKEDLFTLQWRDHPQLPVIVRPRAALGLVHPAPKVRR
jgi:hypothetical protein